MIRLGIVLLLVLALLGGCSYKAALHDSIETREFTVDHKERSGGEDSVWLVFTDHGVFSVEDSFFLWKFDASDRYNQVKVGKSYRCKVAGWRIHFLSGYENLIDCEQT